MVAASQRDGMNALGDANGRRFQPLPFADTTGYQPVNTACEVRDLCKRIGNRAHR